MRTKNYWRINRMEKEEKWKHPDGREITTAGLVRNEEDSFDKYKLDLELSLAGFKKID